MLTAVLALCVSLARAEEVAAILAIDGEVEIVRAGASPAPGAPRQSLDRNDVVRTGEGAAILLLSNNRLVRIDEELELRVDDIVLLDAPKTLVPVRDQLDELLYPGERESMTGIEDAERIAGWQARLQAATAVPAQREMTTRSSAARTAAPAAPPAAFAPAAEAAAPAAPPPPPPPAPPPASVASVKEAPSEDLPRFGAADVQALLAGELAGCLKDWRVSSGLKKGAVVTLQFRVEGGRITRIVGDGGVMPPRCLRDEILGGGADGAFQVQLTLP